MLTAKQFEEEKRGEMHNLNAPHIMVEFAKLHAVRILKKVCKTELEYQRNINLLDDIK